jgi:hypothetical protein
MYFANVHHHSQCEGRTVRRAWLSAICAPCVHARGMTPSRFPLWHWYQWHHWYHCATGLPQLWCQYIELENSPVAPFALLYHWYRLHVSGGLEIVPPVVRNQWYQWYHHTTGVPYWWYLCVVLEDLLVARLTRSYHTGTGGMPPVVMFATSDMPLAVQLWKVRFYSLNKKYGVTRSPVFIRNTDMHARLTRT